MPRRATGSCRAAWQGPRSARGPGRAPAVRPTTRNMPVGAAAMDTDSGASEAMAGSYACISWRVMKPTPRTAASQGSGPRAVRQRRPSACSQAAGWGVGVGGEAEQLLSEPCVFNGQPEGGIAQRACHAPGLRQPTLYASAVPLNASNNLAAGGGWEGRKACQAWYAGIGWEKNVFALQQNRPHLSSKHRGAACTQRPADEMRGR